MFCKTYRGDFEPFKNLKSSVDKFNIDLIPFYIVCPEADISLFRTLINGDEKYKIIIVSDEEVLKANNIELTTQNWKSQQIIKLGFYKLNFCRFYSSFDSDCYFIRDFRVSDFMYDENTPFICVKCIHNPIQDQVKTKIIINGKDDGIYYNFITPGIVLDSTLLQEFQVEVLEPQNLDFAKIIDIFPYEFNWYGEYFMSKKKFYYLKSCICKVFWLSETYFDTRNLGQTVQDFINEGYIAICMQTGWVKENIYKPSKFYKLIKFKRKWWSIWYNRKQKKRWLLRKVYYTIRQMCK